MGTEAMIKLKEARIVVLKSRGKDNLNIVRKLERQIRTLNKKERRKIIQPIIMSIIQLRCISFVLLLEQILSLEYQLSKYHLQIWL